MRSSQISSSLAAHKVVYVNRFSISNLGDILGNVKNTCQVGWYNTPIYHVRVIKSERRIEMQKPVEPKARGEARDL